jgi:hypothetical protein
LRQNILAPDGGQNKLAPDEEPKQTCDRWGLNILAPDRAKTYLRQMGPDWEPKKTCARLGKTILFVTHNIDEALALADRIAVMTTSGKIERIIEVTSVRPRDLTKDSELLNHKRELYFALGVE